MNPPNCDTEVEDELRRWRPAPPSPALRKRVLAGAQAAWNQSADDEISLWSGFRPLVQALAAAAALLLTTSGISGWLADGRDAADAHPAYTTVWTPTGLRTVKVFAASRALAAVDARAVRRWHEQLAAELVNGGWQ